MASCRKFRIWSDFEREGRMARKAQIRYWQRKGGGYFTTIKGQQVELALGPDDGPNGPNYAKALKKWLSLIGLEDSPEDFTVSTLCNAYRTHLAKHDDPRRLENFEGYCKSFSE